MLLIDTFSTVDNAFEIMEPRDEVKAVKIKFLLSGNDRVGTPMEHSQATIVELGNESYQKQSPGNSRH